MYFILCNKSDIYNIQYSGGRIVVVHQYRFELV